jgi:hypothetical protein
LIHQWSASRSPSVPSIPSSPPTRPSRPSSPSRPSISQLCDTPPPAPLPQAGHGRVSTVILPTTKVRRLPSLVRSLRMIRPHHSRRHTSRSSLETAAGQQAAAAISFLWRTAGKAALSS